MKLKRGDALKGQLILLLTAVLWGSCFVFQKKGMDYIGPYTLGACRFLLGALVLLPLIAIQSRKNITRQDKQTMGCDKATVWVGGLLCGIAVFAAATCQQIGLVHTTAGKAAFLTSMEIVVVELAGVVLSRRLRLNTVAGVLLAVLGMYLLCIQSGLSLQRGDIYELVGAVFWGVQIMLVGYYAEKVDVVKLACVQFVVAGLLSAVFMLLVEKPDLGQITMGIVPILYTAVIEVALCYTLQVVGQKYVAPVPASIILSLESVFAVLFGAILLSEALAPRSVVGMALMLVAVVLVQVPLTSIVARLRRRGEKQIPSI